MTQLARRPESEYGKSRTIKGRVVYLRKVRCPRCDNFFGRFSTPLGPNQAWTWDELCCGPVGPAVDPKQLIDVHRPASLRRELALEVERARGRGDRLGELMVPALERLESEIPPEPEALFDLGPIQVSLFFRRADQGVVLTDRDLDEVLDRHRSGDLGDAGTVADLPEITPDLEWAPGVFGGRGILAMTLRSGSGQVRSTYQVKRPAGHPAGVTIMTTLERGVGSTVIVPAHLYVSGFAEGMPELGPGSPPLGEALSSSERRPVVAAGMERWR